MLQHPESHHISSRTKVTGVTFVPTETRFTFLQKNSDEANFRMCYSIKQLVYWSLLWHMKWETQIVIRKKVQLQYFTYRTRKLNRRTKPPEAMTKSYDLWQLRQGLRAERAVIAWNANAIRSLRKSLCYFRTALLSPRLSPIWRCC